MAEKLTIPINPITGILPDPLSKKIDQAEGNAAVSAAKSIPGLGGLASVGQFFDRLTEGSTWIRVGEVMLGLPLIVVGTAKLFGDTGVGRAATKAAGMAALL